MRLRCGGDRREIETRERKKERERKRKSEGQERREKRRKQAPSPCFIAWVGVSKQQAQRRSRRGQGSRWGKAELKSTYLRVFALLLARNALCVKGEKSVGQGIVWICLRGGWMDGWNGMEWMDGDNVFVTLARSHIIIIIIITIINSNHNDNNNQNVRSKLPSSTHLVLYSYSTPICKDNDLRLRWLVPSPSRSRAVVQ